MRRGGGERRGDEVREWEGRQGRGGGKGKEGKEKALGEGQEGSLGGGPGEGGRTVEATLC